MASALAMRFYRRSPCPMLGVAKSPCKYSSRRSLAIRALPMSEKARIVRTMQLDVRMKYIFLLIVFFAFTMAYPQSTIPPGTVLGLPGCTGSPAAPVALDYLALCGSTPTVASPTANPANYVASYVSVTDSQAFGSSDATVGFAITDQVGGATSNGNKVAFFAGAIQNTASPSGNGNVVGAWLWSEAAATPLGGPTNFTASNPQVRIDANVTGITSAVAEEADATINLSSSVATVFGVGAVLDGNSTSHATNEESAFAVWSGSALGWNNGLEFTNYGSHPAISSTGNILATKGPAAVGNFIDFSSYTCATFEIHFSNYTVDCSGSVIAPQLTLKSTSASTSTALNFFQAGTLDYYWELNSGASPNLFLWDQTGGRQVINAKSNGTLQLMPSGGGVTIGGATDEGTGTLDVLTGLYINGTALSTSLNTTAVTSAGNLTLQPANGGVVNVSPAGSTGNAALNILAPTAGGTAYINYEANGSVKWFTGLNASSQWLLWDQAGGHAALAVAPGGVLQVGSPLSSGGTKFSVASGTGACLTTANTAGGNQAGQFQCTGISGASTVTLTLGATSNSYSCWGRDITTATTLTQTGAVSATSVTFKMTSVTTNDFIQFGCLGY